MRRRCGIAALLLVAGALALRADVFYRFPLRADTALQQLGGVCVYTTDVQLNGAPGTLAAYAFRTPASETRQSLAHAFGLAADPSFDGALLTRADKGHLRRFLVLPSPSGEASCVVLAFDQSLRDAAQAAQKPDAWPEGLPLLAAAPVFSAVCAGTRTAFAQGETQAMPEDALRQAAQTLRSTGWTEVARTGTASFGTFVSGKKVCLLFAARAASGDKTTISVLQRDGAAP